MIKYFIFMIMVWTMGEFLCYAIFTGSYPAADTYAIMNGFVVFQELLSGNLVGSAMAVPEFFSKGLPGLLAWDWPMFNETGYDLFRMFILYPLSGGMIIAIIGLFVGTINRLFGGKG